MRRIAFAPLTALLLLVTVAAWSQSQPQAERITDGPKVKQTTDKGAEIAWSTNAPGSSVVKYGTTADKLNETAQAPWGGTKEPNGDYNHTVWLTNLKPNTTYFFIIETGQGAGTGTEAKSQPQQFHTSGQ